jgi:hypothetical protein
VRASWYVAGIAHSQNAPLPMELLNTALLTVRPPAMILGSASGAQACVVPSENGWDSKMAAVAPACDTRGRRASYVLPGVIEA